MKPKRGSKKDKKDRGIEFPLQQLIIDEMVEYMMVIDAEYRVILANKTALKELPPGLRPSDQTFCYQLHHQVNAPCSGKEHVCPLKNVLEKKQPITVLHYHFKNNGKKYPVEITASPIIDQNGNVTCILEVGRDITERLQLEEKNKKLQAQLLKRQKDESIATLAAGIAHDFNNSLTTVIGNAELIKMGDSHHSQVSDIADTIICSANHMARLTTRLLDYAKKGKHEPQVLFLNTLIKDMIHLLHKGKAMEIEVMLDLTEDIWPVFADPDQMRQMFFDLFSNAFEAMVGSQGRLFVSSFNEVREKEWECRDANTHEAGEYVYIRISDTGPGIPEEAMGKIFEPFFSTKFLGRGLGLAGARGIVLNHGGCLTAQSVYGEGATFHIYLPKARKIPARQDVDRIRQKVRHGKILVVDDEPLVRNVLKRMLNHHGFEVKTAADAQQAFDIITNEKSDLRLVILDIQMPGQSGSVLYSKIKDMRLDTRILIATGYDREMIDNEIDLDPEDGFIQKPFEMDKLIIEVNKLMDEEYMEK